ncbi:MAG TPA: PAS domain S-box protein [Vicinamibacterales bacterium]|nr:PAS domain S-box protein [Vicinamibacterales bacterium]
MWLASQEGVFPQELAPDLGLILDSIPDGVYGVDTSGRTILVNRAAARMLGYQPSELIGTIPHDVMHHTRPDGSPFPREECPLAATAAEGKPFRSDHDVFWRRDGTSFPVEYESEPITRDGKIIGFTVTFRDITARLKSEERLRQLVREQFAKARAEFQYAQLRDVLAQTPAIICVTRGARHVIETVNEQFREAVGGREVVGLTIREAFPELDHQLLALMDLAFETGEPARGTEWPVSMQIADRVEERFYNYVYQPLRDEAGYVYGLMTHAVDVTREVLTRRQLEVRSAELERINTRLRLATEAGRLGAWEWHVRSGQVIWSPELERIHGLEPGTFPGTFEAYQADIHPDDRDRVLAQIRDTVERHLPHRLEYRIVPPDGVVRWVEARGQMFLDEHGEPERIVGICMDVTERKRAEAAQLEGQRHAALTAAVGLALTRTAALDAMLQECAEAVVRHTDAAFARIWTLDPGDEVLHLRASAGMYTHLDGPHSRVPVGRFKIGLIAEERQPHLTNHVIGDPRVGDQEWAKREGMRAFAGYPLMVGDDLVGVLAMFSRRELGEHDLAALATVANGVALGIQRKHAEEALQRRADELARVAAALARSNAELDAFAYAASHDLRAPLRGISNLAQWIEEDLTAAGSLRPETREMLELMRSRMHRMEALIDGILQYSRAGRITERAVEVDTRRLVQDVVDLLSVPEPARVDISAGLPVIESPLAPLQQIFMNLIGNALKYNNSPEPVVRIAAADAGEFVEFSVSDNGPGIAPEYHERIWGIFQTLEARDKVEGTGIGLSLVKKLVEGQGGRAWVESAPGDGATFRFLWPRRAAEAAQENED